MQFVVRLIAICFSIASLAVLPASAGQPGPGGIPTVKPKPRQYVHQPAHPSTPSQTQLLNRHEAHKQATSRGKTVHYHSGYRAAANPNVAHRTYAAPKRQYVNTQPTCGRSVTRTYAQCAPKVQYVNPCQINPCGVVQQQPSIVQKQTYYTQPVAPAVPQVQYVAPVQPAPPMAEPLSYAPPVHVGTCGDKIIRKLKKGRDGERRYEVCYADVVHLHEAELNPIVLDRIEVAAKKACKRTQSSFYSIRAKRKCNEHAIESAVFSANLPGLADTYYARSGKARPTVKVGKPVYY